jgi:hypothetical protein
MAGNHETIKVAFWIHALTYRSFRNLHAIEAVTLPEYSPTTAALRGGVDAAPPFFDVNGRLQAGRATPVIDGIARQDRCIMSTPPGDG